MTLGELEDEFKSKKKLINKKYEIKVNELKAKSAKEKTKKSVSTLDDKIAALYEEKVKEIEDKCGYYW